MHYDAGASGIDNFSGAASTITDIFLRLIKMIIAPLVFSTLVVGIAKLGDIKAVGRIGGKTLLWFMGATFLSLLLGLVVMSALQLGSGPQISPLTPFRKAATISAAGIDQSTLSVRSFITHVFPTSIFEAMSGNLILQIVVFSVFFGIATASLGEQGKIIIKALDAVIRRSAAHDGLCNVPRAGSRAGCHCFSHSGERAGAAVHLWQIHHQLLPDDPGAMVVIAADRFDIRWPAGDRPGHQHQRHDPPCLQHGQFRGRFSQADPRAREFRLPYQDRQLCSSIGIFIQSRRQYALHDLRSLPFIAQAYGVPLTLGQELSMLLVLMLTSKGVAGVPRAALVVIAGTLSLYNIPQQGLLCCWGSIRSWTWPAALPLQRFGQ